MHLVPRKEQPSWLSQPLSTPRLQLRPTRHGDEEPVIGLVTDEAVRRYLLGAMSHAQAEESIQLDGELWGHFVIIESSLSTVIGTLSFARK